MGSGGAHKRKQSEISQLMYAVLSNYKGGYVTVAIVATEIARQFGVYASRDNVRRSLEYWGCMIERRAGAWVYTVPSDLKAAKEEAVAKEEVAANDSA